MQKLIIFLTATVTFAIANPASAQQLSKFEQFEGSQQEESALVQALAAKFLAVQEGAKHDGKKFRGTHAKGTCVDGELQVHGQIADTYKVGLFAEAANYKARVRFANGGSKVDSDSVPDARAISISVDVGDGQKQDFAMNNGPIFPIGSLTDFNFLLDIGFVKAKAYQEAINAGSTPEQAVSASERASYLYIASHPSNVPGFVKVMRLGAELKNQDVSSYRNLKYWSGSAFKFGDQHAAKFMLTPCRVHISEQPDRNDPDYLQNDLKNAINSDRAPVCFDFQVQLLDADKMELKGVLYNQKLDASQWVEDVTLDWDKAGAKSYTVGRLTLTPHSVYDADVCDDPANAIDVMKNSLPEHRGLGRINRARAKSEAASKKNRGVN